MNRSNSAALPYIEVPEGSATHVLQHFNGRRLLLPLKAEHARFGKDFFGINAITKIIAAIKHPRRSQRFAALTLPTAAPMASWPEDRLTIYIGAEGPYQKFSILNPGTGGAGAEVAKLALNPAPGNLLNNEAKILLALSEYPALERRTPKMVEFGHHQNAAWLIQKAGIGRSFNRFSRPDPALEFLRTLARCTESTSAYMDSSCRQALLCRLGQINTRLSTEWRSRFSRACTYLDANAPTANRLVMTHRDFTRWNMKLSNGNAFVFDWEYAQPNYPELYDILHFNFLPNALRGRLDKKTIFRTRKMCALLTGKEIPESQLCWQMIFYMVDLSLLYLESTDGQDLGNIVLSCYSTQIDEVLEKNHAP